MTRPARIASLVAVGVAAACAGATFHRAFVLSDLALPLVVAAVVPVLLVLAQDARGRLLPLHLSTLVSLVVWTGAAVFELFRSGSPTRPAPFGAFADGVLNGWARLLDVTLPALGTPDLLIVPFTLTWLAAAAGAELVSRTRNALLPAFPAVTVLGVGVAFTVSGPRSNLPVAALLVVATAGLVLARRAEAQSPAVVTAGTGGSARGRQLTAGLPVAALLAGAALLIGPYTPLVHGRTPYDLRNAETTLRPQSGLNPLDEMSAWLTQKPTPLFRLTYPASERAAALYSHPDLRLAVLDRFDGQSWTSSGRFAPAGRRVPPAPGQLVSTHRLTQQIEVLGTETGTLLPAVDRPVSLDGANLAADPDSGAIVSSVPLRVGMRYEVTSAPKDLPPKAQLAALQVATDPEATADLAVPKVPTDLGKADYIQSSLISCVQQAGADQSPLQKASRLEQCLLSGAVYDKKALPGHTYGHIESFLSKPPVGTYEKFSAAYVIAARRMGLPARIVVGLSAGVRTGDSNIISTDDIIAWPEVDFAGYGWLRFDPTPAVAGTGRSSIASSTQKQSAQSRTIAQAAAGPAPKPVPQARTAPPTQRRTSIWPVVGLAAATVIVVAGVAYAMLALVGPVRRRGRRQRSGSPRERVAAAWRDTLDSLDLAGVIVPAAASPSEAVLRVRDGVGTEVADALRPLAHLAARALFDAREPTDAVAGEAWSHSATVRGRLRAAVPSRRRLVLRLAPGRVMRRRPRRADDPTTQVTAAPSSTRREAMTRG